jgi:hypothetical protein
MIPRHYCLLLFLLLAAHVTGCHSTRPQPDEHPTASIIPPAAVLDTARHLDSIRVIPHRSLIRKVAEAVGLKPAANTVGRIGKKSTVNIYYGPAKVTTVTAGKKAGPVVVADSGSTAQVATNATLIRGDGNTVRQTATPPAPKPGFFAGIKTFFAGLAHWLLWLLLVLLVLAVIFRRRLPVIGPFFS